MDSKTLATLLILVLTLSSTLPATFACRTCHSHPKINPPQPKCSMDALKLGLCLDVLGGLVHVGVGDPVQNVCCPVLGGLLELEAAVCLCTAIKLKVLNLNIYIPLALNVLVSCGMNPPAGYVCPGL